MTAASKVAAALVHALHWFEVAVTAEAAGQPVGTAIKDAVTGVHEALDAHLDQRASEIRKAAS